jgi:hypothetical protein
LFGFSTQEAAGFFLAFEKYIGSFFAAAKNRPACCLSLLRGDD